MKQKLRTTLSKGKTGKVIEKLLVITDGHELNSDVSLLSSRFARCEKNRLSETITSSEERVLVTSIDKALIRIINELPEDLLDDSKEKQPKEEQSSSKNVIFQFLILILVLLFLAELAGMDPFSFFSEGSTGKPSLGKGPKFR